MSKISKLGMPFLLFGIMAGIFSLSNNLQSSKQWALEIVQNWREAINFSTASQFCSTLTTDSEPACKKGAPGCTVFTVTKGDQVFFGGNDDYINPDSYYWVDPGNDKRYGAIWIGKPDNVQQGINEKGLAYDANGLPSVDTNPHLERKPVLGGYTYYPIQILHECATVDEVIEWAKTHRWHTYMLDQMHFADASGDAVVISADADGELAFTRKPPGDSFLLSTNVNVANPSNGYPNENYAIGSKSLRSLLSQESALTIQGVTGVLEDVHVESGTSWTLESMLADLSNGVVYFYYFYQYDKPIMLNITEEIKNDRPSGPFSALFPEEVQQEAARRYQRAISKQGVCTPIGQTWVGLTLASLLFMVIVSIRKPGRPAFWLLVTVILGPLASLVWLVAGRNENKHAWQKAMIEALGHTPPIAIMMLILISVSLLVPQFQSNDILLLLFIFIVPLLVGWIFYQGLFISLASRQSYLRILSQRLPSAWVATNLGMAGAFAPTLWVIKWISSTCSLMPLTPWIFASFWLAVVLGVCVSFLILLIYESWAVHHKFQAWNIVACRDHEISIPSWRQIWWWVLISFPILIGGIIANAVIE